MTERKIALSIEEAADYTGIGRNTLRKLVEWKKLPVLKVGKMCIRDRYWTRRAAEHGDRDGQYNLAEFYEDAIGVERDIEQAKHWYRLAALQNDDLAIEKCKELGIAL